MEFINIILIVGALILFRKLIKAIIVGIFKFIKWIFVTLGKNIKTIIFLGLIFLAYKYFTSPAGDVMLHSTAKVNKLSIGYLTESAYNSGRFDDSDITETPDFTVGVPQYMVIDLNIKTIKKNEGGESIEIVTSLSDSSDMELKVQEAPTGKLETSEGEVRMFYTIPRDKRDNKTVRIILRFIPRDEGSVHFDISMSGTEETLIRGKTQKKVTLHVD